MLWLMSALCRLGRQSSLSSLPSQLHQHAYTSTILQCFCPVNRKGGALMGRDSHGYEDLKDMEEFGRTEPFRQIWTAVLPAQ